MMKHLESVAEAVAAATVDAAPTILVTVLFATIVSPTGSMASEPVGDAGH